MSMAVDVDDATATAGVVKALAEPQRWRIVELLAREDLCVCHLVEELDVPQPLVSHHLRVLRDVGLVSTERYRYWTYYRLEAAALAPLVTRLAHVVQERSVSTDRRRPCC